jgi:flagellar biosynthetic protein FliR
MTIHIDPLWVYTFFLYYFRILFFLIPQTIFTFGVLPNLFLAHLVFALSWLYIYVSPPPHDVIIPHNEWQLLLLVSKEALLGFVLGFFVRILYIIFVALGEIVNLHVGLAMATLMLPGMGMVGLFGNLFRVMGGLLFFTLGGLEVMFYGLKLSFDVIPVTKFNPFVLDYKVFTVLLVKIFSIALAMALPIIAVYMLVNIVLALTNRLVPNVNIFFVGYPIYMLANFALIALLAPALGWFSAHLIEKYLTTFIEFVRSFPS